MIKEEIRKKYDFVLAFKKKINDKNFTKQDENHIRIVSILQLTRDKQIEYLLNNEFTEKFIYDDENKTAYYCVKLKERKDQKCRQSLVN